MKWLYLSLVVLLVGLLSISLNNPEVITVRKVIKQEVYIETVSYLPPEIKEVPFTVFVDRERYTQLKDFDSLEELKAFLANDDTNETIHVTATKAGTIQFNNLCCTFTDQLCQRATERGYRLDRQLTPEKTHAYNMAWIGKDIYYIEPQDDTVWKVSERGDRQ